MSPTLLVRRTLDAGVSQVVPAGLSGMLGEIDRLDRARWYALPDLPWTGRPPGTHGRVLVGPTGVFLLDHRSWTGEVTVRRDLLRISGRSRDPYVADLLEAADSVAALLPADYHALVRPVMCLTRQSRLDLLTRHVRVCSPDTLGRILGHGPDLLAAEHREYVESVVRAATKLETEGIVVEVRPRPLGRFEQGRPEQDAREELGEGPAAVAV